MGNPRVVAEISANDHASAVLRAIARLAAQTARETRHMGDSHAGAKLAEQHTLAASAAKHHLRIIDQINHAYGRLGLHHSTLGRGIAGGVTGLMGGAVGPVAATLVGGGAGLAGYAVTHAAVRGVEEAFRHYLPYEKESIANKAAGHLSPADMAILERQQSEVATKFGEKPEAVVHAQGEFIRRHMNAATTAAMTEESIKLAKALGTNAQEGAKILEGMIFGTGNHVTTSEEAHRLGKRFSDIAAVQAKFGAMSPEDIEAGWKYAASATTAAHISPEQVAATQMVLKREQFGGDESGIFFRQLAARTMMPTKEGRVALAASGIKYDEYVGKGDMHAERINLVFAEQFGKELSTRATNHLQKMFAGDKLPSKAEFVKAAVQQWQSEYSDTKAKDLNVIGNRAGAFYEASKGQVDGAKLLDAMLAKMSPQQILEFLGVKQGAKGISAIQQLQQNDEYKSALKNAGGTAERIATERTEGLNAATERLTASFDDLGNKFTQKIAPALIGMIDAITPAVKRLAGWLGAPEPETDIADDAKKLGDRMRREKELLAQGKNPMAPEISPTEVKRRLPQILADGPDRIYVAPQIDPAKAPGYAPPVKAQIPQATQWDFPLHEDTPWSSRPEEREQSRRKPRRARELDKVRKAVEPVEHVERPQLVWEPPAETKNRHPLMWRPPVDAEPIIAPPKAIDVQRTTEARYEPKQVLPEPKVIERVVEKQAPVERVVEKSATQLPTFARDPSSLSRDLSKVHVDVNSEVAVHGDVRGEATIMQSIRVDASPQLIASMESAKQAVRMSLSGEIQRNKTGRTMSGSNAAAKAAPLGLGAGGFKATSRGF